MGKSESADLWRRASCAVEAVVPASNVHARIVGELLLTEAEVGVEARIVDAIALSRNITSIGFGSGLDVWQRLVGFRMPEFVLALAAQQDGLQIEVVDGCIADDEEAIMTYWDEPQCDPSSGLLHATLTAKSAAFAILSE